MSFRLRIPAEFLSKNDSKTPDRYITLDYPNAATDSKTLLTGVRKITNSDNVFIVGFYTSGTVTSFVFVGTLNGVGTWTNLNDPDGTNTNLYGPNNGSVIGEISVVGNYTNTLSSKIIGCLYQGAIDGSGTWTDIIPVSLVGPETLKTTIMHSNMGNYAVGNFNTEEKDLIGRAFLYAIDTKTYTEIVHPKSLSITAYGIWQTSYLTYTICGGYYIPGDNEVAYLVDWNSDLGTLSNWRFFSYDNDSDNSSITHFDGITIAADGSFNVTGDAVTNTLPNLAFTANISNGYAEWSVVEYPNSSITSGNTIVGDNTIGIYSTSGSSTVHGYIKIG